MRGVAKSSRHGRGQGLGVVKVQPQAQRAVADGRVRRARWPRPERVQDSRLPSRDSGGPSEVYHCHNAVAIKWLQGPVFVLRLETLVSLDYTVPSTFTIVVTPHMNMIHIGHRAHVGKL